MADGSRKRTIGDRVKAAGQALAKPFRKPARAPAAPLPPAAALPPVLSDEGLALAVSLAWEEQREFERTHPVPFSEPQRRAAVEQRVARLLKGSGAIPPAPATLSAAVRLFPRGW